ncbi:hypothetical protein EVJ58_g10412 [Rhodofomes roseus]|uniref:Uncharacterized protein n=1 Tax=Rhodofomes roseus TaxID=34475 RepID=A0A4Y9XPM9_9APHY|nr:hypothetical protein EVJ58_g10412 [Rhodofomes roseus]
MILSRFFLNLREANHTMDSLDSDTSSSPVVLTSLGFHNFSRAADVFGGSLTFIGDDVNVERIADDEGYGDEMAYGEALEEEDSRVPTAVGKQKDTYTVCSA